MKFNRLIRPQHSILRLIFHPHFQGVFIVALIVLLLLLVGCSSGNPNRFNSKNYDECDLLLKKRYAKLTRQPKMNSTHSVNKKTRTVVKRADVNGKGTLTNSIDTLAATSAIEVLSDKEPYKSAGHDNITIAKELGESLKRTSDAKLLHELPKPASGFHRIDDYTNSFLFYGLTLGGPLVLSLLLLSAFTSTSMRVSAWGAHHPTASKFIIGGIQAGTGLAGLAAGCYLGDHHLFVPDELIASASGAAIASSILYPTGKKLLDRFSSTYLKQKVCDVFMFSAGAVFFLSAGNMLSGSETDVKPQMHQSPTECRTLDNSTLTDINNSDRKLDSDPVEKKDGKIGMTILASLLFTAGILVVAGISCSLSCSGAGTGAVLVAVLGGGGLILAYVAMLKNINKKYKVKRKSPEGTVRSYKKEAAGI